MERLYSLLSKQGCQEDGLKLLVLFLLFSINLGYALLVGAASCGVFCSVCKWNIIWHHETREQNVLKRGLAEFTSCSER